MRTANDTLNHWATLCKGGAMNLLRVGSTLYAWDLRTRVQKNGAVVGRVTAQEPGENPRDVGSYKIRADGSVETVPEPLAALLVAAPEEVAPAKSAFDYDPENTADADHQAAHGERGTAPYPYAEVGDVREFEDGHEIRRIA